MITLKSSEEIEQIARACEVVAEVLDRVEEWVEPGISTAKLDTWAEELIRSHDDARPSFKGLYGFPATLCTSINEEVVHGIPSPDRRLREGDIISVDVGVCIDGFYGDGTVTVPVGEIDETSRELLSVTRRALDEGIQAARPGARMGDVSAAIQTVADEAGYGVFRELVGHGIGTRPHEEPQVPNYGDPGQGLQLRPGLVLAIEPMFSTGTRDIRTLDDDWTVVTADGSRSAHFEHTVAITEQGPRILTVVPSKAG